MTNTCASDRLDVLVARIATGDRAAFRTLYAFQAMRVWRDAIRLVPPVEARAVTRSTFVEIWHLAGHHLDHEACETCAWIVSITARHVDDRIRTADKQSPHDDGHDQHTHYELITLLGNGRATIRTAPGTFTRVVDLAS
jgi:DNA-directed RNA polymerase specialized sigma24 family protein